MGKLTKRMRKRKNYARDYCRDRNTLRKSQCLKESKYSTDGKGIFNQADKGSEEDVDEST